MRLTERAHQALGAFLPPGAVAIDATIGNGHDTLFLAQSVGQHGRVFGFDVQVAAIATTRQRLQSHGLLERVTLIEGSHAQMSKNLPRQLARSAHAIVFNLGYLPGADKHRTTEADSTIAALDDALTLLCAEGALSIMAYRGHAEGGVEFQAVADWIDARADTLRTLDHQESPGKGPAWWLLTR